MNEQETMTDPEIDAPKPRKGRTQKADRKVFVYRMADGKPKEFGSFPEAVVGEPLERRLLPFLKELNVDAGDYKIEIRKPNGHFERSLEFSIADSDAGHERIIDVDPEEFDDEPEPETYSLKENAGNLTAEVENLLLKERLRRLEEDAQRQKSGNQGETQVLIEMWRESDRRNQELTLMLIQNAQKPQADAGTLAMGMMQQSLEMVKSAKAMSEEIAPGGSGESSGGFLADGAKMIDSLGRAAPTFLPILAGLMPQAPPPMVSPNGNASPFAPTAANENTGGGELAELAEKIQKKEAVKK